MNLTVKMVLKKYAPFYYRVSAQKKNNILPDGPSTEKERKLLESVNREELLILYPGTKASGDEIGEYTLGGDEPGLADCAKYLMMPKYETWNYKSPQNTAPYVIGWPENASSKSLGVTKNYLDAVIDEMLMSQTMGREVKFKNDAIDRTCQWSKMIDDLLTSYDGVTMKGYGCQKRIYKSSGDISAQIKGLGLLTNDIRLLNFLQVHYDVVSKHFGMQFEGLIRDDVEDFINFSFSKQGPIISTITVNIDYHEGGFPRD